MNDTLESVKGFLTLTLIDFEGKKYFERKVEVEVGANESKLIYKLSIEELPKPLNDKVLWLTLETGTYKYTNQVFLVRHCDLKLPRTKLTTSIRTMKNKIIVTLYSEKYARFSYVKVVSIDPKKVKYSDNYIDILPGEKHDVEIELLDVKEKEVKLRIGALNADEFIMRVSI